KNVANNSKNGITIIFTGIECVLIFLNEITIPVRFVEKNIPTHTEESLQGPGVWNVIILFQDPYLKN
ncbi:MAG TPA: hypothetical protein VIP56_12155, partial [Nitrososphaeraceae archaeon]